MTALTKDTV